MTRSTQATSVSPSFARVHSFQVFIPEKSGWLKYTQSWATPDLWLCNFSSQDGKVLAKTALLDPAQAQEIWERFADKDTCETTYYSYPGL